MSKYLIVEMLENASGLKELRLCSVRWHGCTILYRMISMQLDAKKACCRKRDPLHHPSSSKTRAATLSLQPRFYQQDGGSHAFLSVKVSSTRRGQPRFHSSRGFINKYIQTNRHSLTEDPCIFYLFWDKPFTCSHTIITYAAG